jgi:hypothetical protein
MGNQINLTKIRNGLIVQAIFSFANAIEQVYLFLPNHTNFIKAYLPLERR